jgi:eukaryotic-like serine/threonine-protein kinase
MPTEPHQNADKTYIVCPPSLPGPAENDNALARAAALGRYSVLGLVGRGAMGEVYAAYDPELDRKVAIKLLRVRGGGGGTEGRIRLMREAQAIAKLSHPNVVMVYDVGTFQDDVFIAMQFVDGNTIGYWMHAQPRAWPDILKVFADAGRGLAAAHEKDLIHRDFKPENVMISADGHVRVMDFGLARVVIDRHGNPSPAVATTPVSATVPADDYDPESTRAAGSAIATTETMPGASTEALKLEITQTGAILGTPAYMSPEQFQGLQVDARTDQFSFCVALYEALYRQRPFSGNTLNELMANVLRGLVPTAPPAAKVPSWVRKILLRGLQVNPDERWPSMNALLAELEKSRAGAPRRRFAAGASAKLAGIWEAPVRGRSVATAVKAEIRRAFLATGKRYAVAAFEKASLILDHYAKTWSEMYTDVCEATHVRGEQSPEVLDLRIASLHEGLDSLRALSRVFRQADAEVVENAVSAATALGSVERCADVKLLRAVIKPPEDPTTRATVDRLRTRLAEIRVLCHVGRPSDGLGLIGPLEEEVRRTAYDPLLAETLLELGNLHMERRDATTAAIALEEAVWTAELSRHDEVAAKAAALLVYAVGDAQLRFEAGEIWARHTETILRRMGGHEYLWGWLFNNRGAMRDRQGRLTEAVADARRAVSVKEKVHGSDSADVGMSLSNVAILVDQLGDVEAAVSYIERALKALEVGLGPDHPRTAVLLSNYGEILNRLGRFEEAREMSRRALVIFEGESAPDGVTLSYPLTALGLGYLGDGMAEQALPILERAVEIRNAKENKPSCLGEVHFALARALRLAGREIPRARDLALCARTEYTSDSASPASKRALAQIDAWLADSGNGHVDGGVPGGSNRDSAPAAR